MGRLVHLGGGACAAEPRLLYLVVGASEVAAVVEISGAIVEISGAVVEIVVVLVIAMVLIIAVVDLVVAVARARLVVSRPGIVMSPLARDVAAGGWSRRPGAS